MNRVLTVQPVWSRAVLGLVAAMLMAASGLGAQDRSDDDDSNSGTSAPSVAVAVRARPQAPVIDGELTDEIWATAPVISDFIQRDPDEGEPGTERTEVQIVYTDNALYVGVRAFDSQPELIDAQLTRRDEWSPSDWIGVMIDSYRDRRTAFEFMVNPAGVKRDIYRFNDNNEDGSWDAVWDVATSQDSRGWIAEFRIPFSQIRFSEAEENVFGFNVWRNINRKNEVQYWKLLPKNEAGVVSRFGDLVGLEGISPPRRLEVLPYTVATLNRTPQELGDPFQDGQSGSFTTGADINFGISSALTLTATINPDFGQVEADPAVVNLSAFETFFPEKRPFFNEGLDIFRFGLGAGDGGFEQLFYTRRIGRAPQGSADPRGGYAETVNQTTILSAAKLTGKTQDGWTIGFTGALTAQEKAGVFDAENQFHQDVVEPAGGYMVGRLSKDFRDGQTKVGVIGTGLTRGDDLEFLHTSAYAFGADFNHRFRDDTYNISAKFIRSQVNGSEEALLRTQLSSARYFQRPDNENAELDSTRTSLSGTSMALQFGKHAGGAWRWAVGVDTRSPGFEVNDVGFQRSADANGQWVWLNRRWLQPGKIFRRFNLNFNQWGNYTSSWERKNLGANVNFNFTTAGYWNGWAGYGRQFGGLATEALRGGPALIRPGANNMWAGFSSDGRKDFRIGIDGWYWGQDQTGSWGSGTGVRLSWRPAANMDFTVRPNLNLNHDTWQFLDVTDVLGQDEFVFGEIDQKTLGTQFRGNLTFTPTLSLQIYAEPFVSSGEYSNYQRVNEPRGDEWTDRLQPFADGQVFIDSEGVVSVDLDSDGATDLELGNPNFTFLSFRSNVVLRWEYKLGSTVFLVWQHGRTDFSNNGQFRPGSSLGDLFEADAENSFVVKFNYWLSL